MPAERRGHAENTQMVICSTPQYDTAAIIYSKTRAASAASFQHAESLTHGAQLQPPYVSRGSVRFRRRVDLKPGTFADSRCDPKLQLEEYLNSTVRLRHQIAQKHAETSAAEGPYVYLRHGKK